MRLHTAPTDAHLPRTQEEDDVDMTGVEAVAIIHTNQAGFRGISISNKDGKAAVTYQVRAEHWRADGSKHQITLAKATTDVTMVSLAPNPPPLPSPASCAALTLLPNHPLCCAHTATQSALPHRLVCVAGPTDGP